MLSEDTVNQLNSACSKANKLYEEGGMTYTYSYGHNLLHTLKDINIPLNHKNGSEIFISNEELDKIRHFYEEAMYSYGAKEISAATNQYVAKLLKCFNNDFKKHSAAIASYEPDGASTILKLIFIKDNDYHLVDLFWSLD